MNDFTSMIQDILKEYRIKLRMANDARRPIVLQDMKKELQIMKETWEMLHGKSDKTTDATFEEVLKGLN